MNDVQEHLVSESILSGLKEAKVKSKWLSPLFSEVASRNNASNL